MKKINIPKFLVLMGICISLSSGPALAQTSLTPVPGGPVQMDQDYLVWMAYEHNNWEVYYHNLKSGQTGNLSNDAAHQAHPDVWSHYVVWEDSRNYPDNPNGRYDIYLYDFNTGSAQKISQTAGDHREPIIANNKVVWTNRQDGKTNIILYDLTTATQNTVHSGTTAFGVKFDGQVIAWTDFQNGNSDIYAYDLNKQTEIRLTSSANDEMAPLVGGGQIVWAEEHNGSSQIYAYSSTDELTRRVSAGPEDHTPVAFDGNALLLKENGQLYLNQSPNTAVQQPVALKTSSTTQVILQGDQVFYLNGGQLEQEAVTTVIERGITELANPKTASGGSSGDNAQFSASIDNIFKSPGGNLTLNILRNTFKQDFALGITELPNTDPGNLVKTDSGKFLAISPIYQLETGLTEIPAHPIKLTLTYTLDNKQPREQRKIALYQQNPAGGWEYIPSKHNLQEQTIQAEITSIAPLALMIYQVEFTDLKKHWAQEAIETIAAHQAIKGYPGGSFQPENVITRAEFTKLLLAITGEQPTAKTPNLYQDVSPEHWAKDYIATASQKGWVRGFNNRFNPDSPLNREEMVTILMRALGNPTKYPAADSTGILRLQKFQDKGKISPWAREFFSQAIGEQLIQGSGNRLNPTGRATRAEAAALLYRYLSTSGRF
ncbi:MAG: S-layer homology domain-containing protein [Carboxydocellales bacterium]